MSSPALTPSYLRSLASVRQRSALVYDLARRDRLHSLTLHEDKLDNVVDYCIAVIRRDYGDDYASIPPHSRWRHFVTPKRGDLLGPVVGRWHEEEGVDDREVAKRLIDLFVVSVLLDAGAGPTWRYFYEPTGEYIQRSEGLAVASLDMFLQGAFSSSGTAADVSPVPRVDSKGLGGLTADEIGRWLQCGENQTMAGLEGRSDLLIRLGGALEARPDLFGGEDGLFRPGNMVDVLVPRGSDDGARTEVDVEKLWEVVMDGFGPIWPEARTTLGGVSLGDAWRCEALAEEESGEAAGIVPFHKLSQWLTYSLMEPLQKVLGCEIVGVEQMTGLPEYRNGGLLLDLGLVEIKDGVVGTPEAPSDSLDTARASPTDARVPRMSVDSQTVVEWRCLTVIALDKIAERIREKLGAPGLSTAQVLEAATWKAGRQIAKETRPGGGPPIDIISDGTVF